MTESLQYVTIDVKWSYAGKLCPCLYLYHLKDDCKDMKESCQSDYCTAILNFLKVCENLFGFGIRSTYYKN